MLAQITPYRDVNEILGLVLQGAGQVLGPEFVGMYLYGSLSSGDFDPGSSDIDFVVVTAGPLPAGTVAALESMHTRLWAGDLAGARKLEGAYIPRDLIRHHDPQGAPCPTVNEGRFYVDRPGSDWIIQRHVIREKGVIVKGPDPKTLIDPVSPDEIRQAIRGVLSEWWFPMLDDPSWLRSHGSHYQSYAVISMCRALHGLAHGSIVSKPVAAQWAQAEYSSQWGPLIEKALAARRLDMPAFIDETLDFIRFTKECTEKGIPSHD